MNHRVGGLVFLLVCILLLPISVEAQNASSMTLTAPETEAFPRIEAYLDVRDGEGKFIHGLREEDLQVSEDGIAATNKNLSELRRGLQIVAAINPNATFAVRNSRGVSRYDFVLEALNTWAASRQGSTVDDLSLVVTGLPNIAHIADPLEWQSELNAVEVDARSMEPNLDTLFRAVEVAADPTPQPAMGRAVLLVTPVLEGDIDISLKNLLDRAKAQDIRIFIWLVTPTGAPVTDATTRLIEFAGQSGGRLIPLSGDEASPDPEQFFEPLRNIYRLSYDSQIKASGAHTLAVEVREGTDPALSTTQDFQLDIRPPNPVFVSPTLEIVRRPPQQSGVLLEDFPVEKYTPTGYDLEVLVDFPDGRLRPLAQTRLFVDGALVDQNTTPPFERFRWDLSQYAAGGEHLLRVEAEDSLGLKGTSIETLVQVSVERPEPNPWHVISKNIPILSGLAILVAGSLVLLAMILKGRIRPGTLQALRRIPQKPFAQPPAAPEESMTHRFPRWVSRLQWAHHGPAPQASAFLTPTPADDLAPAEGPIPIFNQETTFGSDPLQVDVLVSDPSVEGLHARLVYDGELNSYHIFDHGSTAGTWVNYTPVPPEGAALKHGDLIHMGGVSFRLAYRRVNHGRKPVIHLLDTIQ